MKLEININLNYDAKVAIIVASICAIFVAIVIFG